MTELETKLTIVERHTKMVEEAQRMLSDRLIDLRKAKYDLRGYIATNEIHGRAFRVGDRIYVVDHERDDLHVDVFDAVDVRI